VTRYNRVMIKTFADKLTHEIYITGRAKRFPSGFALRAARKLVRGTLLTDGNNFLSHMVRCGVRTDEPTHS
jgi:hypothetical protein